MAGSCARDHPGPWRNGNPYERHDYLPITTLHLGLSRQNDAWSEAQIARNVKEAVLRQLGQPGEGDPIYMISGEVYFLHPTNSGPTAPPACIVVGEGQADGPAAVRWTACPLWGEGGIPSLRAPTCWRRGSPSGATSSGAWTPLRTSTSAAWNWSWSAWSRAGLRSSESRIGLFREDFKPSGRWRGLQLVPDLHGLRRKNTLLGSHLCRRALSNSSYRPVHDYIMGAEYVAVARIRQALAEVPKRYLKSIKTDCLVMQDVPKQHRPAVERLLQMSHPRLQVRGGGRAEGPAPPAQRTVSSVRIVRWAMGPDIA